MIGTDFGSPRRQGRDRTWKKTFGPEQDQAEPVAG